MTSSRSPVRTCLRLRGDGLGGRLTWQGCRELSTQAKHTLRAVRKQEKVLKPGVGLAAGAGTPGVARCSSWFTAKASSLWIDWPNLNPSAHYGDAVNCYLHHGCSTEKIFRRS